MFQKLKAKKYYVVLEKLTNYKQYAKLLHQKSNIKQLHKYYIPVTTKKYYYYKLQNIVIQLNYF